MNDFFERIIRAVRLDAALYSEVKADREAMGQAMTVVALSGLASGVGSAKGLIGYLIIMFFTFTVWLGWSFIVYMIGTRVLAESGTARDYTGLLRATGFAYTPHILQALAAFPGVILFVTVGTSLWTLFAIVIAVRQALAYQSTFRAIWVVIISIVIQALLLVLLTLLLGGGAGPV